MDEYAIKREIRSALEEHQPKYDEDGPRRVCSCNQTLLGGQLKGVAADHQALEVMRRLRSRGLL
jgi:hypothetical protein